MHAAPAAAKRSLCNLRTAVCFIIGLLVIMSFPASYIYADISNPRLKNGLTRAENDALNLVLRKLSISVKAKEFLGIPMHMNSSTAPLTIAAATVDVYLDDRVKCAVESVVRGLPTSSRIVIMHGSDNIESKRQALSHYIASGKIQLYNLGLPVSSMTFEMYSALLQFPVFYEIFHVDRLLVYQHDSVICSKSDHSLEDFLQYDYIGAPWAWSLQGLGNGGFSLRNVGRIRALLWQNQAVPVSEDVVISKIVRGDANSVIPPLEARKQFSVESMYYPAPFGVHQLWNFPYSDDEMATLISNCPELLWISGSGCDAAMNRGKSGM